MKSESDQIFYFLFFYFNAEGGSAQPPLHLSVYSEYSRRIHTYIHIYIYIYIYIYICYSSPANPLTDRAKDANWSSHAPAQECSYAGPSSRCACLSRRAPDRAVGIRAWHSWSSQHVPNWANQPCAPPTHVTHPFFDLLSHFAKALAIFWFYLVILLQYQTFCYSALGHPCTVNSALLLY
jgi:hypothetical protein